MKNQLVQKVICEFKEWCENFNTEKICRDDYTKCPIYICYTKSPEREEKYPLKFPIRI